jgi:NifU-like protein involved in Fe-S cluster formation/bacterioferritin-associated ferredoxin
MSGTIPAPVAVRVSRVAVPKVVLDHYKNPRNKRAIEGPTARGAIDGRKPEEVLTVYLKVESGTVVDASFTNTGDRMDDPGASALTELVRGKPVADVARLGVDEVARALESPQNPGIGIVAHEALRAALFSLRNEPVPPSGRLICHCFHVPEDRIRRYVREKRLATVEDVRTWTRANSGCRSCRPDIEQIIAEELPPA